MSSDDEWIKRWKSMMPFGPWSFPEVEEMMKEMEKSFMSLGDIENLPKDLVKEKRAKDGSITREVGPIVYGYSMTVGPDGKPVIREFGNLKPGPHKNWHQALSAEREPLVDVVDGENEVRVVAELPGARKEDILVAAKGNVLEISAETRTRKYRKELELPTPVEAQPSRSTFNNGVLEATFQKRKAGSRR